MLDFHTHTFFSNDSRSDPAAMIDAARRRGVRYLAFTDHADFAPTDFRIDPDAYFEQLGQWRGMHDGVEVFVGIEIGWQISHTLEVRSFLERIRRHACDVVIASFHRSAGLDIGDGTYMRGKTLHDWWRGLLEEMLSAVQAEPDFDILGHLDMMRRYPPAKGSRIPEDLYGMLDRLLGWLAEHDKTLECNSSGFRYGLDGPHPEEWVFKRFRELGGRRVSLGSDAHVPDDVGYWTTEARKMLQRCGFSDVCGFRARVPFLIPL
ncbi:MAG TPA: histidinol-phosphatase HisJ family protein [Candidatus Ozemobacteraceae bacterium]|nr:histidinol-phosphatase HisJ family protein [Candidatus Ozemobacteraceae bacterium]